MGVFPHFSVAVFIFVKSAASDKKKRYIPGGRQAVLGSGDGDYEMFLRMKPEQELKPKYSPCQAEGV